MILNRLKIFGVIISLVVAASAFAQGSKPKVTSYITPDTIMIGSPFNLVVDVEGDVMQQIAFPDFDTEDQDKIEYVDEPKIDTIKSEGRRIHLRRTYRLRSFDEGAYNLGRISVLSMDKNVVDTLYAPDSLRLMISTFKIDSTALAKGIVDIKPQREMPFKFAEISGYVMWVFIALVILLVLAYVVLRVLAHYGKNVGGFFKTPPPVPPHVRAIEDLEHLHNKKLWQSNKHKLYYSGLTDILRTYISGRYLIAAREMTTDEIIEAIRSLDMPSKCAMDLQSLLRDADLVKFAKFTFEAEQNEAYYNKSYHFVEETKITEESSENKETEEGA